MKTSYTISHEKLYKAFQFTPEELTENRRGCATPSQLNNLKSRSRLNRFAMLGMGVWISLFVLAFGIGGLIFLYAYFKGLIDFRLRSILEMGLSLFLMVSFAVFFFFLLYRNHRKIQSDRSQQRVDRISGTFRVKIVRDSESTDPDILRFDNGGKFKITRAQARALKELEGRRVTAYFFPKTRKLVSVEVQ